MEVHPEPLDTYRVIRDDGAVRFEDDDGTDVDPLVVLARAMEGPVTLKVDDFAISLNSTTFRRLT